MKNSFLNYSYALLLSSLLLLFTNAAQGSIYQSPTSITQAVSSFLKNYLKTTDFTVTSVDKRLRLKACANNLRTQFPQYAEELGRTTVEVSCNGPKAWKILVSVYIQKYLNIIASKHSLPSGSVIQASDIKLTRRDVSRIHGGYFTQLSQMTHMVVRRPLKSGKIISPSMLTPKRLVQRGDEVLILATTEHLTIRVKGKALMSGVLGQRIRVKNIHSKRIFQATVISNGLVRVNM